MDSWLLEIRIRCHPAGCQMAIWHFARQVELLSLRVNHNLSMFLNLGLPYIRRGAWFFSKS